jgi:hypothetical protein
MPVSFTLGYQVKEGEEKYPDDIYKMPVESYIFDQRGMQHPILRDAKSLDKQRGKQAEADKDMKSV